MANIESASGEMPITIPHQGMVEFVYLIEWLRDEGSAVSTDQPVAQVETDKATITINAPGTGTLHILVEASDAEIPPGTVIGSVRASA